MAKKITRDQVAAVHALIERQRASSVRYHDAAPHLHEYLVSQGWTPPERSKATNGIEEILRNRSYNRYPANESIFEELLDAIDAHLHDLSEFVPDERL